MEFAYAPHGTILNLTKALTVVSVEPCSVWHRKVEVGDIIGLVQVAPADSPVEAGCGPLVMTRVWTPATDVQFRHALAESRRFASFTFHVARKKQTCHINDVNVDRVSKDRSDDEGIISERLVGVESKLMPPHRVMRFPAREAGPAKLLMIP
jgi:hypothetical protein